MNITEFLESSQRKLLKQLVAEQERYLKTLFGEGGFLEGQHDNFVLEENPLHIVNLGEPDDKNMMTLSTTTSYRIRPKTPEEKSGRGEGTGSSGA